MHFLSGFAKIPILMSLMLASAHSQSSEGERLRVAIKSAAPFAIQDQDGNWQGITVDLWSYLSRKLGLSYSFVDTDLEGMLNMLGTGEIDVAAAALTITSDREAEFDFTHPFHVTGLSIAVPRKSEAGWLDLLLQLLSVKFLKAILLLGSVLLGVGILLWLAERKRNPEQFGKGVLEGLGSGFWWSAVTMTTVGYGDKSPVTFFGRFVAVIWMFAAIIIISGFTAGIASALTVGGLQGPIQGPEDLGKARVGTVGASTSSLYLENRGLAYQGFDSPSAALEALRDGRVEAVVYDEPILRYLLRSRPFPELRVLPESFEIQYYGLGLPEGSSLRENLNRIMLEYLRSESWTKIRNRYLGDQM